MQPFDEAAGPASDFKASTKAMEMAGLAGPVEGGCEGFTVFADIAEFWRADIGKVPEATIKKVLSGQCAGSAKIVTDPWRLGMQGVKLNSRNIHHRTAKPDNRLTDGRRGEPRDDTVPLPAVGEPPAFPFRLNIEMPGAMSIGVGRDPTDDAAAPAGAGRDQHRDERLLHKSGLNGHVPVVLASANLTQKRRKNIGPAWGNSVTSGPAAANTALRLLWSRRNGEERTRVLAGTSPAARTAIAYD
jgi:hypothetical protein